MIQILNWTAAILTILYALLLMAYRYWFSLNKVFEQDTYKHVLEYPIRFTIVIPARTEALNIKACLDSILAQDYPTEFFEVIVIDDIGVKFSESLLRHRLVGRAGGRFR